MLFTAATQTSETFTGICLVKITGIAPQRRRLAEELGWRRLGVHVSNAARNYFAASHELRIANIGKDVLSEARVAPRGGAGTSR